MSGRSPRGPSEKVRVWSNYSYGVNIIPVQVIQTFPTLNTIGFGCRCYSPRERAVRFPSRKVKIFTTQCRTGDLKRCGVMNGHRWARLLTYVSGLVNEELLLQLEYLASEIGKRLGQKGLEKIAVLSVMNLFTVEVLT